MKFSSLLCTAAAAHAAIVPLGAPLTHVKQVLKENSTRADNSDKDDDKKAAMPMAQAQ